MILIRCASCEDPAPRGGEQGAESRGPRPEQPPHGGQDHSGEAPKGQRESLVQQVQAVLKVCLF